MDSREVPKEDLSVLVEAAGALMDPFDSNLNRYASFILDECRVLNPEAVAWCAGKTRESVMRVLWGIFEAVLFLEKHPELRRPRVAVSLGESSRVDLGTTGDFPVAVKSPLNEPDANDFDMFDEGSEEGL